MTRKPSQLALLFALCCLAVFLAASTASASSPTEPAPMCTAQAAGNGDAKDGLGVDSYCEVDCGSFNISTNCAGECSGIDRNCNLGERGRVKCNGSTVQVCPVCPSQCSITTECPDGSTISCSSSSGNCDGGPGICWVECDNNYTWCPGYEFQDDCSGSEE